jgi:cell division protein FtsQ
MAEEKYKKRRRRGTVLYTPIAVLLIAIITIFGISVFFRISSIEITGEKKYTAEQILTASGIKKGDNLIILDAKAVSENISLILPYLSEIDIDKVVPDKIVISVTESEPIAVVSFSGSWWMVDQKARVLEKTDDSNAARKIKITGMDPVNMVEGRQIIVDDSQQTKLQYLTDILSAIYKAGLSNQVGTIDMSNIGNISFTYSDRFTVELGSGENADHKLELMQQVISQLTPDDKGKISLSDEGEPHFIP